jgi:Fur family ferric uptake transcriptional regulator
MDSPLSELKTLKKYLSARGMRCTPEREAIVGEIFSRSEHFSAEGLYQRLRGRNLSVSRASVYRTIPLLRQAGLIERVFQENGHSYYEHIGERHCHLRCLACGRIEEFADPALSQLARRISGDTGFLVEAIPPLLSGLCPACREKQRPAHGAGPAGNGGQSARFGGKAP